MEPKPGFQEPVAGRQLADAIGSDSLQPAYSGLPGQVRVYIQHMPHLPVSIHADAKTINAPGSFHGRFADKVHGKKRGRRPE